MGHYRRGAALAALALAGWWAFSTDLPRNTVALGWDMTINSGTSAAITTMQFGGVCYVANP